VLGFPVNPLIRSVKLAVFTIKKGYDLPLEGEAALTTDTLGTPDLVSVMPEDFPYFKFQVLVQEGDEVQAGTPLIATKQDPDLVFTSPVAGTVAAVRRGERRKLLGVDVKPAAVSPAEPGQAIDLGAMDSDSIRKADSAELCKFAKKAGVWALVRQRPFNKIANPDKAPKAIYINAMNTAPLAPSQKYLCQGKEKELQAGIDFLSRFQEKIFLISSPDDATFFKTMQRADQHQFDGPHPSGLTSTHISRLSPMAKDDIIWSITAAQLTLIGEALLTGKTPTYTTVALTGGSADKPRYLKVIRGTSMKSITSGKDGTLRLISGDVLTGSNQGEEGFLGFYDNQVTVIPEGGEQHYLLSDEHWTGPGLNSFSVHNLFLSKLLGKKKWNLNTSVKGGHRAIIQNSWYEDYSPLDIYITFLVKACIAGDIGRMEELGILEIVPEDVAICAFIDPSKLELCEIIQDGLNLLEKEG